MIFLHPNFLLFMMIPLLIFAFFIMTNKKKIDRIFDEKIIKKLIIRKNFLGLGGQNILLFVSLLLFIIALARPVIPKEEIELKTKKTTYAILLDISASMLAKDIFPNRLKFAINKISSILEKSDAKISLYAFSDKLYQISPLSDNHDILLFLIRHLEIDKELSNSSNLYDAIKNIKEKNVLIFSDGTEMRDFSKIKKFKKNIIIYLTATKRGSSIFKGDTLLKDKDGNIVISKANYNIKDIGKIIDFSYKDDLKDFSFLKNKEISFNLKEYDELFIYFLIVAGIVLFFNFFSFKNLKIFLFIGFLYSQNTNLEAFELKYFTIQKATKAYHEQRYKDAIKLFKNLLKDDKSAKVFYDLANCYYMIGDFNSAIKFYNKVVSKDDELNFKVYFNMANSYFKLKRYKEALYYYKKAKKFKKSKKIEKNLDLLSKYIKITQKDDKIFIIESQKSNKTSNLKIKTLLIPLTKGKKSDISW